MILRDITVILLIQIAMVLFACSEAYMEGAGGWKWNPAWWRIKLPGGYTYTAYHFFTFVGFLPLLIIVFPLVIVGWDTHLFRVLLFSYIIGTRVEDFMWFVINPLFPLRKWNPKETTWYPWVTIGKFSIPLSYLINFSVAAFLFYFIFQDWSQ